MAGDCHVGGGQHPCCKMTIHRAAPIANIERGGFQVQIDAVVALISIPTKPPTTVEGVLPAALGLPPPAPPVENSVLRI
jgi:hypothetical protein